MSGSSEHTEWLSLVDRAGAFLAVPVLEKAFPQGLDAVETPRRQRLRAAYEEWRDAVDEGDPLLDELHQEWIRLVFTEILEYDSESLKTDTDTAASYTVSSPERTESFSPNWVVVSPSDTKPRMFVSLQPPGTDLERVRKDDRWPASLRERMTGLCRLNGVRLGLITDGERWMLVNAPSGATSGDASWYARIWFQEPLTLKAFQSLLGVRRCFGPADDTLDALLERSLEHHEEITDTLGEQVRRAVEVLVQCLDKADADRNRELLRDVSPAELYEAGLTVMMRLVFVLCAEERGLSLSGDPVYDECYAVSTLRAQLAEEADRHGPEVLERRHDAWARLLAVCRAVYGGVDHESLRMPALGGSLFDPDRFPFLEGRPKGTTWRDSDKIPLPIDNRTVLLLLNSLQSLKQHGGALLLSYRALDVEQIGHVYEGLLEHTVARVPSVTLGLAGSKGAKNPNIALSALESARMDGDERFVALVVETTGRSRSAVVNSLDRPLDDAAFGRLLSVCGGDTTLAERIHPFANLLRADAWGDPIVYRADAFMVTLGTDRRETGTHYTPKSLTESIVETTLEPVVYVGPAEGKPREEWRLKTPAELLDLKICDPAMGSGAFLVQVCRWLAERVVESWTAEEAKGKFVTAEGAVLHDGGTSDPMPTDTEERLLVAKRLIAERCLYGVDVNPLAVELAKLSIWLVTLAKGMPFGFLDHNLRCGDSLLGIHSLDQLTKLKMNPDDGRRQYRLFGRNVEAAVAEAIDIRGRMRSVPIRDIRDVETMASMDVEARKKIRAVQLVADAMIGQALLSNGNANALDSRLESLAIQAGEFLDGNEKIEPTIARKARVGLSVDLPEGRSPRKPFHWPLEFPEVFRNGGGIDAIVGNPPFRGGLMITRDFGLSYTLYLKSVTSNAGATTDLCAYFYRRAYLLLHTGGVFGLLATNSIYEGDTRATALEPIVSSGGAIFQAVRSIPWPGKAALHISLVHLYKGVWSGVFKLDGLSVQTISDGLTNETAEERPKKITPNAPAFLGTTVYGRGFFLSNDEVEALISANPKCRDVIKPFLNGEDVLNGPNPYPSRYVLNFQGLTIDQVEKIEPAFSVARERIYPERQKSSSKRRREKWWLYTSPAEDLYLSIRDLKHVFVTCFTSKYIIFEYMETEMIFSNAVIVVASEDFGYFSLLQSSFHGCWVQKYSSTLETRQRYALSDCYETFPASIITKDMKSFGYECHRIRHEIMRKNNIGLTETYNKFHNLKETANDVGAMRDIHREIDRVVARAYGWDDLDLGHGFHELPYLPENDRERFTISETARIEILRRLAVLNRERYEEEVRRGLHGENSTTTPAAGIKRKRNGKNPSQQSMEAFDDMKMK